MTSPSLAIYQALENAFEHFNRSLFDQQLPPCLLTLRSSRRTYGYMHKQRFVDLAGQQVDELALNPAFFALRSPEEILSTMVHEMVHHWQNHFGLRPTASPHNREWAAQMQALGLIPSHSGLPGGKRTGQRMSHYILPDGRFIRTCANLCASGWSLPWLDSHIGMAPEAMQSHRTQLVESGMATVGGDPPLAAAMARGMTLPLSMPPPSSAPRRLRYVCPLCDIRAWAAPETSLACGVCDTQLTEAKA